MRHTSLYKENMKASRWTRDWLEEGEDFQLVSNIAMPFLFGVGFRQIAIRFTIAA